MDEDYPIKPEGHGSGTDLKMVERYEAEMMPPPEGLTIPKKYGYIHYKAYSYLARGPEAYRQQDALGMPPEGTSPSVLALIERGCRQILEWRGISPQPPLESIGIAGFYRLVGLFHFEVVLQRATFGGDGTILDSMTIKHVITDEEITLYNRVGRG